MVGIVNWVWWCGTGDVEGPHENELVVVATVAGTSKLRHVSWFI